MPATILDPDATAGTGRWDLSSPRGDRPVGQGLFILTPERWTPSRIQIRAMSFGPTETAAISSNRPMLGEAGIAGTRPELDARRESALVVMLLASTIGADVDQSAIEIAGHLDPAAIVAVVEALIRTNDAPHISRIRGYHDPEDPTWPQLLLAVDNPGEPGSNRWRNTLDSVGRVIEKAIDQHPEAATSIASQVSFEL